MTQLTLVVLSVIEILALAAAVLGFIVHISLAYAEGLSTRTNHFVGVFACLLQFPISSFALYVIWSKNARNNTVMTGKQNSSHKLRAISLFLVLSLICGFMASISYWITGIEMPGAFWSFVWFICATIPVLILIRREVFEEHADGEALLDNDEPTGCRKHGIRCGVCCAWTSGLVASLFIILFTYQAIATANDAVRFGPYGMFAQIVLDSSNTTGALTYDNYKIHAHCLGTKVNASQPTYWFEHGGGISGLSFYALQQELAAAGRRSCVYDRGGYGYSDIAPRPRSLDYYLTEIDAAMNVVSEPGPFIMVGHSVGGQLIQLFAKHRSDKTAALVLLDSYPNYLNIIAPIQGYTQQMIENIQRMQVMVADGARAMTFIGWPRWVMGGSDFYPPEKQDEYNAQYFDNRNWQSQWADLSSGATNLDDLIGNYSVNPGVRVVALHAGLKKNCEQAQEPEGSAACIKALNESEAYYRAGLAQAYRLSPNATFEECAYPCAHSFVWVDPYYKWILQRLLNL